MRLKQKVRSQAGFTLNELMAVVLLSTISMTFIYYLFIQNTELYSLQEEIANAQSNLQFASSKLQSDLQRTGYMAPIDHLDKRLCVKLQPTTSTSSFQAVQFFNAKDKYSSNGNLIESDRIELLGNFLTSEEFQAEVLSATTLRLKFDRQKIDQDAFQAMFFSPNQLLSIRGTGGQLQVVQVKTSGVTIATAYSTGVITLVTSGLSLKRTAHCGVASSVWVAPLSKIRYRIVRAANNRWTLLRETLYPTCAVSGANLTCTWAVMGAPHPPLVIADEVVDMQFWFVSRSLGNFKGYDPRSTNTIERTSLNDDMDSKYPADTRSIRSVFFRLTVRTQYEDKSFPFISRGSVRTSALRTPIRGFNLNSSITNAAHVRNITKNVLFANFLIP